MLPETTTISACQKQAFLLDVILVRVAPQDKLQPYTSYYGSQLRRSTGLIPKLLVSLNHLHAKTC